MFDSIINFFANIFNSISIFFSSAYDLVLMLVILLITFVTFKFIKYIALPSAVIFQLAISAMSIGMMITFILSFFTTLIYVYNKIFALATNLSNITSSLPCMSKMLSTLGLDSILSTYFTELFFILITVLLIRMTSYVLWAFSFISERIWRIGVLLGLAS
jgi:hypothetical protein